MGLGHYWLSDEKLLPGFWNYAALRLERADGPNPAYEGLPLGAALRFGPLLLRRRDPLLPSELQRQERRLSALLTYQRPEHFKRWREVSAALRLFE